jgi:hypothetical protein
LASEWVNHSRIYLLLGCECGDLAGRHGINTKTVVKSRRQVLDAPMEAKTSRSRRLKLPPDYVGMTEFCGKYEARGAGAGRKKSCVLRG